MTKRIEFTAKTKDQGYVRAGGRCEWREGGIRCEAVLSPGNCEYDHVLPLALGGTSELANMQCLCKPHHLQKTAGEDVPRIRKADRQRRNHIGARVAPVQTIESAPMPISERTAARQKNPKLPVNGMTQLQRAYLRGLN